MKLNSKNNSSQRKLLKSKSIVDLIYILIVMCSSSSVFCMTEVILLL